MKVRAYASVYWPRMSKSVAKTRLGCKSCNENAPSKPTEILVIFKFSEWPSQKIAADYSFINTHSYLVVADRYGGRINVNFFRQGQAKNTVLQIIFEKLFVDYGNHEKISSDGGRQFIADQFQAFLLRCDVHHRLLSAKYPQSNR